MTTSMRKSLGNRARFDTRSLTACAAATLLSIASGSALADITIGEVGGTKLSMFGIIDVGMLYNSKAGPNDRSKTSMETSGLRQTVIGFKGERELQPNLTAFFNLESHFDTNDGFLHGTGDAAGNKPGGNTPLFRRQANLGVRGDWGSVTVGRQYGPALLAHIGTEPRAFKEQFSNLYGWAYGQLFTTAGATGGDRNTNNDVGIFFSNAVQYRHTLGPVNFGVLWSFGGQPGSIKDNSAYALGATYNGPIVLSASYQAMRDEATGNDNIQHTSLGFAVPFGDFAFKTNWMNAQNEAKTGVEQADIDGLGMGLDWKWSTKNSATVAYYINKDKANRTDETKTLVLSNDYQWRPDTTLYVALAYADADAGATLRTSVVAAGVNAGVKSTLLNVGLNFNF
ncbi:MAG: porin [Gammaproteobacteria bacterium]|jgi:predicted porin|nr:porin [Gammaproteobacteria bacterium]MBU0773296.1 porin [Gammaproteobacteria bacterium]MBU0858160.1 porin [Gammaproteobacteria bacterium]MBU1846942.1 porin [Gammaproteobacteria bacterium]